MKKTKKLSFLSKLIIKNTYKKVYGKKATILVNTTNDTVDIIIGDTKYTHDLTNHNKLETNVYEGNKRTCIKINSQKLPYLKQEFDGDKLVSEEDLLANSTPNCDTSTNCSKEESVTINGTEYKNQLIVTKTDTCLIEFNITHYENCIKETITKKSLDTNAPKVLETIYTEKDYENKIISYSDNDTNISITYYENSKQIQSFTHIKKINQNIIANEKTKKKQNKTPPPPTPNESFTSETATFDKAGRVIGFSDSNGIITKCFNNDGSLKTQYIVLDKDDIKQIIGKTVGSDKNIKIINNSSLTPEETIQLNKDIENIDIKLENNIINLKEIEKTSSDFLISENTYLLNKNLILKSKTFDCIINRTPYTINKLYSNGQAILERTINNISKTEFILEGNNKKIKDISGVLKPISNEEFLLYKLADDLNKLKD